MPTCKCTAAELDSVHLHKMSRYQQEIPNFVNARSLVTCFALTWYKLSKYRKHGVVPLPDGYLHGRPLWLHRRLEEIRQRIAAVE
jgi:hypothetical protein